MAMLALMIGLSGAAFQTSAAEPLDDRLLQIVVQAGYHRVGILPRFIQVENGKEVVTGSLGPLDRFLADQLAESLVEKSHGQFQVVDNRRMLGAIRTAKLSVDDLGNPEALKRLAQDVGGLDALIEGSVVDKRTEPAPGQIRGQLASSTVTCKVTDLRTGNLVGSAAEAMPVTGVLAAYRGESDSPARFQRAGLLPKGAIEGGKAPNIPDDSPAGVPPGGGARPNTPPGGAGQPGNPPVTTNPQNQTQQGGPSTSRYVAERLHPLEIPGIFLDAVISVGGKPRAQVSGRSPVRQARLLGCPRTG